MKEKLQEFDRLGWQANFKERNRKSLTNLLYRLNAKINFI